MDASAAGRAEPLNGLTLLVVAVAWIAGFGLVSARMATGADRRAPVWFALGALLGPVALIVLITAPPGRCRTCGTPTILWHQICWWCHEDVRTSPAATVAIVKRMSERIADAKPAESEPEPESTRVVEPPKPFVIRSDAVRPQPFTLTGASPRGRIRTTSEPAHGPEVAPGLPDWLVNRPRTAQPDRLASPAPAAALEAPATPRRRGARTAGAAPKAEAASAAPTSPQPEAATPRSDPARRQDAALDRNSTPKPEVADTASTDPTTEPGPIPAAAPGTTAAPQRAAAEPASSQNGPFVPASYHSGNAAQADADQRDAQRILATAVFVAGSARLQPGHRYSLALRPDRLLVLGPTDVDPAAVVLDRAVADIEARSLDGRLILSEPNSRSGLVLAFMSVAGASTEALASTIADAARTASTV